MLALDKKERYRRPSGEVVAGKETDTWPGRGVTEAAISYTAVSSASGSSANMLQARAHDASILFMPMPAPMLPNASATGQLPQRRQSRREGSGKVRTGSGKVRSSATTNTSSRKGSGKIRNEGSFDAGKKLRNGSARNLSAKKSSTSGGSGALSRAGSRSTARGVSGASGAAAPDVAFSGSHKSTQKARKSGRRSSGRSRVARERKAAARESGLIMASSVERGRKEERARAWEEDVASRSALPARLERLAEASAVENVGDSEFVCCVLP